MDLLINEKHLLNDNKNNNDYDLVLHYQNQDDKQYYSVIKYKLFQKITNLIFIYQSINKQDQIFQNQRYIQINWQKYIRYNFFW